MVMRRKQAAVTVEDTVVVPDWVLWSHDRRYVGLRVFGDRGRIDGMYEAVGQMRRRARAWCVERGLSYEMTARWASEPTTAERAAGIHTGVLGREERRRRNQSQVFADALAEYEADQA